MYTTNELIDRLKASYFLPSDYAAAKKIGISTQSITNYRNKGTTLSDKAAVEIAELLELDPFKVLACIHIERAEKRHKESEVTFWKQYAN